MTDILIENGHVVTLDPARRVLEPGWVLIRGDRIAAVGGPEVAQQAAPDAERIDARRKAVLPGLIDCHGHAGHALTKNLGGGKGDGWVDACIHLYTVGSDRRFWEAEARLASLERLKAGVTTAVSFFGGGSDVIRNDAPDYALAYGDAVGESGTRCFIALGPNRHPFPHRFVRGEDGAERLTDENTEFATVETVLTGGQGKHDGRVNYILSSPLWSPTRGVGVPDYPVLKAFFERVMDLRSRIGCLFTQDGHHKDSISFGADLGTLGPWSLFSHAVDLTGKDLDLAEEAGLTLAHNPSAVMSIVGRCPAPEAMARGINVAISSDAGSPDRSYDLFRHMIQAQHYHRRHFRDPDVLPGGKALEMTTIDAAKGLHRQDDLGSLEPGKKADVILVDLMKPHMVPLNHVVSRLTSYANAGDVDTVIVDGVVRMRGRKVLGVDETAVLEEAIDVAERVFRDQGLEPYLEMPEGFWGDPRVSADR
ncbi:MAG: amidohydrolase family protein [Alphaproteobacteria bacterium]|nr:amidohydrolase family protein [Alphaproteobacteria bacterium]